MPSHALGRNPATALVIAVACAAALAGCVERRMVIRSQPAGARLLLDLEEIEGRTPLELPFQWGGTREVVLLAPGYEVFEGRARLEDRWHSYFPLDLFAELLYPGTIEDVQAFDFELTPYLAGDQPFTADHEAEIERRLADLRRRADDHRRGGSAGPRAAPTTGSDDDASGGPDPRRPGD